jgi:hypothetical protein
MSDVKEILRSAMGEVTSGGGDSEGAMRRAHDRERRRRIAAGVVAFAVFVSAGVALWYAFRPVTVPAEIGPSPTKASPSPTPSSVPSNWVTFSDPDNGFSVAYPPDWTRARESLTPNLSDPHEILSLGTYPLRPEGTNCAEFPGNAVSNLGANDAFITLQEQRPGHPSSFFEPRPTSFGPTDGQSNDEFSAGCVNGQTAFEHHWIPFTDQGRNFYAYVAIGADVSDSTRAETWEILHSLKFQSVGAAPSQLADVNAQLAKTVSLGRPASLSSIAYGDGSAWVALREGDSFNQYSIVRLDGETGQQIAKVPVESVPDWEVGGGGLVFGDGSLWVAGRTYDRETQREGGVVIQIDPRSNSVVHTIPFPAPVDDLVFHENGLWILTSEGRTPTLERIDQVSGDVAASIALEGDVGRSIVSAGGTILALVRTGSPIYGDIVYEVDPSTNEVAERYTTKGSYNAIAETNGRVWIAVGDGLLWIDPAAGQGRVLPESFNTGDVVAAGDGGVWILGPSHGRAPSRYDMASGTLGPSVDVDHHAPISMTVAPGALWAANDDGTVSLITLNSGQPSG